MLGLFLGKLYTMPSLASAAFPLIRLTILPMR